MLGGADPLVRGRPPGRPGLRLRNPHCVENYFSMAFYLRRLPHIYENDQPVFLTWRLHDSLPSHRAFPADALTSGQAFAALDRLLDEARGGAFYLRQPVIAEMIVEAIEYNASVLGHYVVHSFVVMPNHVHLLATPAVALPKLTKSLKGITAKRANAMLGLTGKPFLAGREL
jgi:putative transposase